MSSARVFAHRLVSRASHEGQIIIKLKRLAAVELLLSTARYLAGRYPKTYMLFNGGRSIVIPPVNETYSLPAPLWVGEGEKRQMREVSREEGEEALRTCALL